MHRLKSLFYALVTFLAATSVSVGPGGAVLLQLPSLANLIAHPDLYAGGLLTAIEIFSRVVPSSADNSLLTFLARIADSCLPNRSHDGGRFISRTLLTNAQPTL
jgi:hypothetical protein